MTYNWGQAATPDLSLVVLIQLLEKFIQPIHFSCNAVLKLLVFHTLETAGDGLNHHVVLECQECTEDVAVLFRP